MKKAIYLFSVLLLVTACDQYPDPAVKSLKSYTIGFEINQGSRYNSGELVSDSVKFRAINTLEPLKDSVKVIFEVIKGGGEITVKNDYTDKNGYAITGWKLGTETFDQILRAYSYDLAGNFLTSTDLLVYGFRTDEWDTLPGADETGISSMAADTLNKVTFVVKGGRLYKQGDRYYIWKEVTGINYSSLRTIFIDRKNVFYLFTWNGELLKSADHGESWFLCSKPYSQLNFYVNTSVTSDNYIWISTYNLPTKYSKDSGQTWIELGSEISAHGLGDIFRLKDGSLILHGADCCSLFRSTDNGISWTKIETTYHTYNVFVDENDDIFLVTHPLTFYKSTDYGVTFKYAYAASPAWISTFNNIFNKRGNHYFIKAPGFGVLKSADLINFDLYWLNPDLRDLFIDHNGVLLTISWNMQPPYDRNAYYHKYSE